MHDIEDWSTGRLLSTAARLLEHSPGRKLGTMGLSSAGLIALDVLMITGPLTQVNLAQCVRVRAQTVGRTLLRLESHGYIQRETSPGDRRGRLVSITTSGAEAVLAAHRHESATLALLPLETDSLRTALESIVFNLAPGSKTPPSSS